MQNIDWKSLPSLSALRVFDAAARHDSFSAAARSLNVTHAAVAQQVRALEKDLGVRLVERSPQGIGLTEAGRRLGLATATGFGRIATAVEAERRPEVRRLRVTTTTYITDAVILPRLGGFWEAHPEIELSFAPSRKLVDIEAEGFDVAIRTAGERHDGENEVHLMTCSIVAVAAPSLVTTTANWDDVAWLGHCAPWEKAVLEDVGLAGVRIRDVGNPGLEVQAARNGIGPAFGSEIVFLAALRDGSLVRIPFETRHRAFYYARINPGSRGPALDAFLDWLKSAFSEAETELAEYPRRPA